MSFLTISNRNIFFENQGTRFSAIKIANNIKSNHIMVSFTDHYNAISPQKLKLEKIHGVLIILFYVSPSTFPLQSCFKKNCKILSKNFTTQKNITISR